MPRDPREWKGDGADFGAPGRACRPGGTRLTLGAEGVAVPLHPHGTRPPGPGEAVAAGRVHVEAAGNKAPLWARRRKAAVQAAAREGPGRPAPLIGGRRGRRVFEPPSQRPICRQATGNARDSANIDGGPRTQLLYEVWLRPQRPLSSGSRLIVQGAPWKLPENICRVLGSAILETWCRTRSGAPWSCAACVPANNAQAVASVPQQVLKRKGTGR